MGKYLERLRCFMCEEEIRAVRGRYPQLTCLGALLVTAHEKWCRPRFILPLTVVAWACWAAAAWLLVYRANS